MDMRDLGLETLEEQPGLRAQGAAGRLDQHEFGVQRRVGERIDHDVALGDVVDRDQARQHGDPIGPRHEFERPDHGVHLHHGVDLDPVGLKVGLEIAPTHIVRARHDDLERPAVAQPHRRQRGQPAAPPGQQHLAVAHQQARLEPDTALECRYDREVELVGKHHVGEQPAIAFDDVKPHIGVARDEIVEGGRQHGAREGRHQADPQVARHESDELARFRASGIEHADRLDATPVVAQARRGRHDAGAGALEQPDLEGALDRGDMLRDAGLGRVLARRRARERAFLAHRNDGANLPQRNPSH